MEGHVLSVLSQIGLPPAVVGLIVSLFVWVLHRRTRDEVCQQKNELTQVGRDVGDLRERVNTVEKDAMQRYVSRDDYLVWMQRIEAKLDRLNSNSNSDGDKR